MKPLDVRSRGLLERARPAEDPSEADRARVRARVMAKVAGAGLAAAGAATVTEVGAASAKAGGGGVAGAVNGGAGGVAAGGAAASSGVAKAILVGAIAGLFASGVAELVLPPAGAPTAGVAVIASAPLPSARPVVELGGGARAADSVDPSPREASSQVAPAGPVAASGDVVGAAGRGAASAGAESPAAAASATGAVAAGDGVAGAGAAGAGSVRDEVQLLMDAQKAIVAGETDRAMALLDAHEGRFKGGAMAEERLAARAIALCNAGRDTEARGAAAAFFAQAKGSQLEGRVRGACSRVLGGTAGAGVPGTGAGTGETGRE